jgi:cobalt-zinc-cadmium efflux system protein
MDVNITDILPEELNKAIKINDNIIEYHDLHIYKPSSKYNLISFHIVLKNNNLILEEIEEITSKIKYNLRKYSFNHILIQVDTNTHVKNKINCELEK